MPTDTRETAFEIAERINRAIASMAQAANTINIPITQDQARLIYARCVQSTDRKWIGHQHYTINADQTLANLNILAPAELLNLTRRTLKDAIHLLYKTDVEPGYSVTPRQLQDLYHPDATVYRTNIDALLSSASGLTEMRRNHHRRFIYRLDLMASDQATELHRAVMALPLREAIPGTATPDLVAELIQFLAQEDIGIDRRQAIMLHELANHRPLKAIT